MKKQLNVSHLIALTIGIIIPLVIWGGTVEKRFVKTTVKIENNIDNINFLKKDLKDLSTSNQINFEKVLSKLHNIELSLKDKKDK